MDKDRGDKTLLFILTLTMAITINIKKWLSDKLVVVNSARIISPAAPLHATLNINKMILNTAINTVLLITLICSTSALNILGIFPYPGKSHFIVFDVLLKELVNRGHNLTVISHFPQANPLENYHDIPLGGSASLMQDIIPLEKLGIKTLIFVSIYLTTTGRDNCDMLLGNKEVYNLMKKKPKFDVILVEQFNSDCALGIAYKLAAPVVGVTSHVLMPWHYDRFGIPSNPSFVSLQFLGGGTRPSLLQKMERILWDKYFKLIYYFISQSKNQASLEKHFGEIPLLEDLGREVKVLLLYQHYSLTGSSLFPPNVIEVGGYHIAKPKLLTGVSISNE